MNRSVPRALLGLATLLAACKGAPAATEPASAAAPSTAAPVAPSAPAPAEVAEKDDAPTLHLRAEGQLGPGTGTLFIDIAPPDGAKLTLESPVSVRGSGGIGLSFPRRLGGTLGENPMPLRFPIQVADGATGPVQVELSYYWCTDGNEAACRREKASLDVELDLSGADAGGEAHLSYRTRGDKT